MKDIYRWSFVLFVIMMVNSLGAQKTIQALRITEDIKIDAVFDEPAWQNAEKVSDFVLFRPNPGEVPDKQTFVQMAYDDQAIYVAAFMPEVSRDSVMQQLTERDDFGNTDFFGFFIDTYGQNSDAFEFLLASTGVQFDAIISESGEDSNWDAVWSSKTRIEDDGWYAEFKIPYFSLRFPKKEIQTWNINFMRRQARTGEQSSWTEIDPLKNMAILLDIGKIEGIKDIKPPVRLSFFPYVSTYAQKTSNVSGENGSNTAYSYNAGLDLKYGINDAFTLDMTLIPDFGQVRSDDLVLNLSPFEVRFDENRPFFTEGLDLFKQGNIFYSRRIGGTPIGMWNVSDQLQENEEITDNPSNSRLYNSTKISGRTSSGLGIGLLNGLQAASFATVKDTLTGEERKIETSPIVNYNALILDQNLANSSSLTFMNFNVWRFGDSYYDSNVSRGAFRLNNKNQTLSTYGSFTLSQKYYAEEDNIFGHSFELGTRVQKGFYRGGIWYEEESPNYDVNDFGFQRANNYRELGLWANYSDTDGWGPMNRVNLWFNYNYERRYNPNVFTSMHFNTGFWMQSKSLWSFNFWTNYRPKSFDYFEPRREGRFYEMPAFGNAGFSINSDNRKKFQFGVFGFMYKVNEEDRKGTNYGIDLRYRFSDKFTLTLATGNFRQKNDVGFTDNLNDDIIFAKRERNTFSNNISAMYNFNDNMNIDFRLRHYWSKLIHDSFHTLTLDGHLGDTEYNEFRDLTFNRLNIDMVYRWRFAPGSDIFVVWKNNIVGVRNDESIDYHNLNYFDGVRNLSNLEQLNSISVRIVYFLDYNNIKNVF